MERATGIQRLGRGIMFKPGDVVRLKSGGPEMTVDQAGQDMFERDRVWVTWFDNNKLQKATFAPEALEKLPQTERAQA